MPDFETVDAYIAAQPEATRAKLTEIRQIIHHAVPGTEELMNYKVPAFSLVPGGKRDKQIMMAAYTTFIGFYPFPTTMAAFESELKEYKKGKGSVQFPLDKPLPKELIARMIRFRRAELINKA